MELVLNAHNKVNNVETVCAEIIDNVAVGADIILVDFKLFGYYLLQSFEY